MLKNRTTRVATLLLALTLITCCFVGSTFAKYTSTAGGSDTVTVAKWSFKVNGTEIVAENGATAPTFDLFQETAEYDEEGNDVAQGKVAPGTKGSFNVTVQNTSEVSAKYTVTFTVTFPAGVDSSRFKFYSDSAMTQEIAATDGVYTIAKDVEIEEDDEAVDTMNVYWQWTIGTTEEEDTTDTTLGQLAQNGTTVITVTPKIDVEQVD